MEIRITEYESILKKLEIMQKLIVENSMPAFQPAEKVAEKFDVTTQTLSNLAREGIINKYKLGDRRVFYSIPEIYEAIREGAVHCISTRSSKR